MPQVRFTRYGSSNAAPRPAPARPVLSPPTALLAPIVPNELVATPSVRKAYFVGQIIDPTHPELMYRPGIVYREEIPERWNRNPLASRGAVTGVIAAVPDPAILPPSSAEQQQLIAQQRRVMELLSAANADLDRRIGAKVETSAAPSTAAVTATPPNANESGIGRAPNEAAATLRPTSARPAPAVSAPSRVDLSRALVPNADGAIELSPEILDEVDRSEPNPFVKRYQAQTIYRDIVIEVTGTSPGPRPTASVSGRLVNVGDVWEGFVIAAITRDAVYLQKDVFLLQIPLARQRGVTLRLPQ